MSATVSIRVNLNELEDLSDRWLEVAEWLNGDRAGAEAVALKAAQHLVGAIREHILDTSTGRGRRSGALARSFREEVKVTKGAIRFGAHSDLVYAQIQDEGGRVFPKNTKRLAIPLIDMVANKWPRHWPRKELFRRGNALSRRLGKGKKARVENVYALAKHVDIPAKHYLDKARAQAMPDIAKLFVRAIVEYMAK